MFAATGTGITALEERNLDGMVQAFDEMPVFLPGVPGFRWLGFAEGDRE
jgi:hypothetical protein